MTATTFFAVLTLAMGVGDRQEAGHPVASGFATPTMSVTIETVADPGCEECERNFWFDEHEHCGEGLKWTNEQNHTPCTWMPYNCNVDHTGNGCDVTAQREAIVRIAQEIDLAAHDTASTAQVSSLLREADRAGASSMLTSSGIELSVTCPESGATFALTVPVPLPLMPRLARISSVRL